MLIHFQAMWEKIQTRKAPYPHELMQSSKRKEKNLEKDTIRTEKWTEEAIESIMGMLSSM